MSPMFIEELPLHSPKRKADVETTELVLSVGTIASCGGLKNSPNEALP